MAKTPKSHHRYDGKRFYNLLLYPDARHLKDVVHWLITRKPHKWPKKVKIQQKKIPTLHVGKGKLRVTFINHSTTLIQMDNLNILTDPIWSQRCGPFRWAGLKRVSPPGVRFDDLPPIDIVLISHNHYDHLDLPTLKRLYRAHKPLFCVSRGNKKLLRKNKLQNIEEFDWWETKSLFDKIDVTFVPAQHFSRRGLMDHNKTLWGGYVIQGDKGPVYFAGDTGYGPHFKEIRSYFGNPRLSLLPIGAYQPRWFMSPVHMSPDDAVKAHLDLGSDLSVAIHFGTFRLSDEMIDDPINELIIAMEKYGVGPEEFVALEPGGGISP